MTTPMVLGKVFKSNKWIKAPVTDIELIGDDYRLKPFHKDSYQKNRKYVVKDEKDSSKLLYICIVEFAESEAALDKKITDEDGNRKRYTVPRRLSIGPVEFERSDFEEEEVKGAKLERAALESAQRSTVSEEGGRIISTMSSKLKKVNKTKKQSQVNPKEAQKASLEDDLHILKSANKAFSPRKRKLVVVGPSPKKRKQETEEGIKKEIERKRQEEEEKKEEAKKREAKKKEAKKREEEERKMREEEEREMREEEERKMRKEEEREMREEEERKMREEEERKMREEEEREEEKRKMREEEEVEKKKAKKRQEEKKKREEEEREEEEREMREEEERKMREEEENKRIEEEEVEKKKAKKRKEEKKKREEEENKRKEEEEVEKKKAKKREEQKKKGEGEEDNGKIEEEEERNYSACGNAVCSSQLKLALLTAQKSDERYDALLQAIKDVKSDLKDIKAALSTTTPTAKLKTCKIKELRDVNVDPDNEYTIPEGKVHVGGGRLVCLVDIAKVEKKTDDLRGRLKALCNLYWPGHELNYWSLSGKKGGKTVNKITNDYTAGMAEILSAMHWRKKANLNHDSIHRTLCRVISEIEAQKKGNKPKARKEKEEERKKEKHSKEDTEADDSSDEEAEDKEEEAEDKEEEATSDSEQQGRGDEDSD